MFTRQSLTSLKSAWHPNDTPSVPKTVDIAMMMKELYKKQKEVVCKFLQSLHPFPERTQTSTSSLVYTSLPLSLCSPYLQINSLSTSPLGQEYMSPLLPNQYPAFVMVSQFWGCKRTHGDGCQMSIKEKKLTFLITDIWKIQYVENKPGNLARANQQLHPRDVECGSS